MTITEITNRNMDKDFFFKVYVIYRYHWGEEDSWRARQQQGVLSLHNICSKSPKVAFIKMLQKLRSQSGSATEPIMISRDLMLMSSALLKEKSRVKTDPMRFCTVIPKWSCLRYPDMMPDKELARRVLAIVAW